MNEQELLNRIKQLEAENAKLRNEHRKWRDRLPENARQNWDFIGSGPFSQYLSWMIRYACFKPVDVKRDRRNDKHRIVSLIEMTNKEYETYICAVTEILDVFKKYRDSCMSLKD